MMTSRYEAFSTEAGDLSKSAFYYFEKFFEEIVFSKALVVFWSNLEQKHSFIYSGILVFVQ